MSAARGARLLPAALAAWLAALGASWAARCSQGAGGGASFAGPRRRAQQPPALGQALRWRQAGAAWRLAPVAKAAEAAAPAPVAEPGKVLARENSQALFTAFVTFGAVLFVGLLNEVSMRTVRVPLWSPPEGAVALVFAGEATAAVRAGKTLSVSHIADRALTAGSAVAGACVLAVATVQLLGGNPLGRATAVAASSLWMYASPVSRPFAPVGAFCALYVDQVMAKGPLAPLLYRYALCPCLVGTALLLVATRVLAALAAAALRALARQ